VYNVFCDLVKPRHIGAVSSVDCCSKHCHVFFPTRSAAIIQEKEGNMSALTNDLTRERYAIVSLINTEYVSKIHR